MKREKLSERFHLREGKFICSRTFSEQTYNLTRFMSFPGSCYIREKSKEYKDRKINQVNGFTNLVATNKE